MILALFSFSLSLQTFSALSSPSLYCVLYEHQQIQDTMATELICLVIQMLLHFLHTPVAETVYENYVRAPFATGAVDNDSKGLSGLLSYIGGCLPVTSAHFNKVLQDTAATQEKIIKSLEAQMALREEIAYYRGQRDLLLVLIPPFSFDPSPGHIHLLGRHTRVSSIWTAWCHSAAKPPPISSRSWYRSKSWTAFYGIRCSDSEQKH